MLDAQAYLSIGVLRELAEEAGDEDPVVRVLDRI
jgi:hypothetical protein